jgi:hypothetical protein
MTDDEVLLQVITAFDSCGLDYMITGSLAANVFGVPRTTNDADLVVSMKPAGLDAFLNALPQEFYRSREAAEDAVKRHSLFNLIHSEVGFKIDVIILKDRPFSLMEFSRRQSVMLEGRKCWFASPEDVILSKLEWAKLGESERQVNDALNIARVQKEVLDLKYINHWASELGIVDLWETVKTQAGL